MVELKRRIVEIAYKNRLGHLGSYFSSLEIIDTIFSKMKDGDIFILSSGHAALALYVCLEKYKGHNADLLFEKHGGHPHWDIEMDIQCSTGSLGMGIAIAVGRAISNPNRTVYVLISDGECAEGSVWESLKTIYEHNIQNIEIHVNINGYAAYNTVDVNYLSNRLKAFLPNIKLHYTTVEHFPFLKGLNAHYHIMKEVDYETAMGLLK
jgi:transketolase